MDPALQTLQDLLALPRVIAELKTTVDALNQKVDTLQKVMPPTLVSVAEAAERLGVRPKTIRKRVQDGTLRHIKLGGQIRIDLGSVQAALK